MDISKLKKIHSQIQELKEKADIIDSKKETRAIEKEIKALELDFDNEVDNLLEDIPDEIELRIKVNKVVKFDTWDFKSWIGEDLLERNNLDNLDIIKELKVSIDEDFDPSYEIDNEDVTVEFEDDKYK
jgi:hypothetical protein